MISTYLAAVNSPMVLIEECAGLSVEELVDKGFSDREAAEFARLADTYFGRTSFREATWGPSPRSAQCLRIALF